MDTLSRAIKGIAHKSCSMENHDFVSEISSSHQPHDYGYTTQDGPSSQHENIVFREAKAGDRKWQAVLERYSRLVEAKRATQDTQYRLAKEIEWQDRLRHRPVLTGGFIRPSVLNKPLPRMKPQPIHISMMMRRRRDARQRRLDRLPHVAEFQNYLVMEQQFEKSLAKSLGKKAFKPVFKDDWASPLEDQMQRMAESGKREEHMARMKYSPELLEQVRQARITKIENKTREKERERRGEVLSHTRKRMNKGLPAHLLGAKESLRHKMLLDPSEGGYTGMVKKMARMKLVQDTEEMENAASNEIKEVEEAVWQEGRRRAAGSGQ